MLVKGVCSLLCAVSPILPFLEQKLSLKSSYFYSRLFIEYTEDKQHTLIYPTYRWPFHKEITFGPHTMYWRRITQRWRHGWWEFGSPFSEKGWENIHLHERQFHHVKEECVLIMLLPWLDFNRERRWPRDRLKWILLTSSLRVFSMYFSSTMTEELVHFQHP